MSNYTKTIVEYMQNEKLPKEIKLKKINFILKLDKECINAHHKRKTPLSWAIEIGDQDFIDLFTSHGGIANIKTLTYEEQIDLDRDFVISVTTGNLKKAQELLNEGAHVEASVSNGYRNPVIVFCAGSRDAKTVEFLLNNGAFIDTIDRDGCTPLINAIVEDKVATVKLLVERGANIHTPFALNRSAYEWANDEMKSIILEARKTWCTKNGVPFTIPKQSSPQSSKEKVSIISKMRSLFSRD